MALNRSPEYQIAVSGILWIYSNFWNRGNSANSVDHDQGHPKTISV